MLLVPIPRRPQPASIPTPAATVSTVSTVPTTTTNATASSSLSSLSSSSSSSPSSSSASSTSAATATASTSNFPPIAPAIFPSVTQRQALPFPSLPPLPQLPPSRGRKRQIVVLRHGKFEIHDEARHEHWKRVKHMLDTVDVSRPKNDRKYTMPRNLRPLLPNTHPSNNDNRYAMNSINNNNGLVARNTDGTYRKYATVSPANASGSGIDSSGSGNSGNNKEDSPKAKRMTLPPNAKQRMLAWIFENKDYPYPSEEVKQAFGLEFGLTTNQVNNWFINARRRILKKIL